MKKRNIHPEWALKHKKPGTELRLMKGRYYLYEVSSKWNKEKKRAQKITGKILGRITEDKGFIASLEGWMFINYLVLLAYLRILKLLVSKKLLSKVSIKDLLIHLSYIKKIRINGEWHQAEITNKTKKLFAKLGYAIT